MAILPVLVLLVLTQLGDGGMDTKALAMLGVLAAINAALRPLGAGLNGIETVFFLLILGGPGVRPGLRFPVGLYVDVRLSAADRWCRPVAAVPDAVRRVDRARRRTAAAAHCSAVRSTAAPKLHSWPGTGYWPRTYLAL